MIDRKRIFWWLRLLFSLGLLFYLISRMGFDNLVEVFISAHAGWFAIASIVLVSGFVAGGLNLFLFYRFARRGGVFMGRFMTAFFDSQFHSFWLPGRAGDFIIAYSLRREVPISDSLLYVVMDKLISLFAIALCFAVGISIFVSTTTGWGLIVSVLVGAALLIVAALNEKARGLVMRLCPSKFHVSMENVFKTFLYFNDDKRWVVALNLAGTMGKLLISSLTLVLFLKAGGDDAPFVPAFFAVSAGHVATLLPISIQGIGLMEGVYIFFLAPHGVSEAGVIFAGLTGRVVSVLGVFLIHFMLTMGAEGLIDADQAKKVVEGMEKR